jgi:ribonuclease BN (tRNA processing enzyme)
LLRQLYRAGIALASIRHVFITHRHFDHAGGLAPLLVTLCAVPGAHLTVYAPPVTLRALHDLLTVSIPGVEDWLGDRLRWSALSPGHAVAAGSALVTPFAVEHGVECVGFRVLQDGRTLTFSADTRPCATLLEYARGADVLIHEAYGPHETADEAHRFGHATAADAGRAAQTAGVGHLVLTHLRAGRLVDPLALQAEAAGLFDGPVTLAADGDTIAL